MSKTGIFGSFFLIVFIIAIAIVVAGFDQVDASHLGVKVKLGEIIGVQRPGLQWTGLFVDVNQYDMRTRKAVVSMDGAESATDSDGQAVFGTVSVNYRLKNNEDVVQSLYSNIGKDDVVAQKLLIDEIIREGFKQATVQYEAIEILQNRQEVKDLAKENIAKNFPQEYFEIEQIVVTNIDFSEQFKAAIEAKKVETQNKLKEEQRLEVVRLQQEQEILKYEAEAKKLELQKQQVTDQLNTQRMLDKWDGQLPSYLIITPDSNGMFLQLAQGDISSGTTGSESKYEESSEEVEEQ